MDTPILKAPRLCNSMDIYEKLKLLWAPVRTCCVLAGFKMLMGLRQRWRDGVVGEADADRLQTSA